MYGRAFVAADAFPKDGIISIARKLRILNALRESEVRHVVAPITRTENPHIIMLKWQTLTLEHPAASVPRNTPKPVRQRKSFLVVVCIWALVLQTECDRSSLASGIVSAPRKGVLAPCHVSQMTFCHAVAVTAADS